MAVILQPIAPQSTGAVSVPEYTSDGGRIERPAIPSHENCAILTKCQQIQTSKGEKAVVEWIFRNEFGEPVNLTIILGDSADDVISESSTTSISTSAALATHVVKARFTDCDFLAKSPTILETTGTFVDTLQGIVRFPLPVELGDAGGLYRVQVAIVECASNRPVLINKSLWTVEEGLFGDVNVRTGMPSLGELRGHMRDTAVENDLLDDVEFDDEELVQAIARPIHQWNETPPPVARFSCNNFPYRYNWLNAIVGDLMLTGAHHYMRNNLRINHGGLQGNFKDKHGDYLQVGQLYRTEWKEFIDAKKLEINAGMATNSLGSPYAGW